MTPVLGEIDSRHTKEVIIAKGTLLALGSAHFARSRAQPGVHDQRVSSLLHVLPLHTSNDRPTPSDSDICSNVLPVSTRGRKSLCENLTWTRPGSNAHLPKSDTRIHLSHVVPLQNALAFDFRVHQALSPTPNPKPQTRPVSPWNRDRFAMSGTDIASVQPFATPARSSARVGAAARAPARERGAPRLSLVVDTAEANSNTTHCLRRASWQLPRDTSIGSSLHHAACSAACPCGLAAILPLES